MTSLACLLAEKRMSHSELARRSGVSRDTITRLANGYARSNGKRRSPDAPKVRNVANLAAFAWALDVPIERLSDLADWLPEGPRSEQLEFRDMSGASA